MSAGVTPSTMPVVVTATAETRKWRRSNERSCSAVMPSCKRSASATRSPKLNRIAARHLKEAVEAFGQGRHR